MTNTEAPRTIIHFTEFRVGLSTSTICNARFNSSILIADRRTKSKVTCLNCLNKMAKKGLI